MKKTIQRVLAAVILFAMILSGGFSEVGKVHAEKQIYVGGTSYDRTVFPKSVRYTQRSSRGQRSVQSMLYLTIREVCMGTATKHGLRRLMRWKFLPR